jgi:argininosuccinate lyase
MSLPEVRLVTKLWGGRFQKKTNQFMEDFHSSLLFDQ